LVAATQRPDANVLNPQAKANLTTRIGFRVASHYDSQIILDRAGAERIKRVGLALTNAGGQWRKVQCAFVPDEATGEWVTVMPKTESVLSDIERSLVAYAIEELGGAFKINALYQAHKGQISQRKLTTLAQKWERRGWLTSPASRSDSRKVTSKLLELCPNPTLSAQNDDTVIRVLRGDTAQKAVIRTPRAGDTGDTAKVGITWPVSAFQGVV
ncbi:MAG: hypothetical protein DRI81_16785, partial [Chloroflexi bacterium]